MKPVERRPATKSGCAMMRWRIGIVVCTPATVYSPSARVMRAIAASRSGPHTMSLAISVS